MGQVAFYPNFVDQPEPLTAWLSTEVEWQDETITLFGKRQKVPRQVAWFGDAGLDYRYSGLPHLAQGWPPPLQQLRLELEDKLGLAANFVLANRYRSGSDYMGWHRDDEPGQSSTVVSVSFGATRRFRLEDPEGIEGKERQAFDLGAGSLLLHPGGWRHTLPKTAKPVAERFNLSFRQLQRDA